MRRTVFIWVAFFSLLGFACADGDPGEMADPSPEPSNSPEPTPDPTPGPEPDPVLGWLFALGNEDTGNEVIALRRYEDGTLEAVDEYPTGGLGSGGGLGSQSALAISPAGEFLYAVNAGSDQVSSFRIFEDHLSLVDVTDSGGVRPTSLTVSDNRLYVVNAGGSANVAGFALEDGIMIPIAGANQPLSETAAPTAPAQVGLNPDGTLLVVSEKATNRLTTYVVADDGTLSAPQPMASEGQTPFGFAFTSDGVLIVSEAHGGAAGASTASSYVSNSAGTLTPLSSAVPSGQSAACWIALAGDEAYAYATNTASSTISGYDIAADGTLTLFEDGGVTMDLGSGRAPIDMAVSEDGQYVYVLSAATDTITGMRVAAKGTLVPLSGSISIPASAAGLAGR